MEFFIELVILAAISLSILIPVLIINKKYVNFVLNNSEALREIEKINALYDFYKIENFIFEHSYDNERFYDTISCQDYLTYQLVYVQSDVNIAIFDTLSNRKAWHKYTSQINDECVFNSFGNAKLLRNKKKLKSVEEKLFQKKMLTPQIDFSIYVKLYLTNINGNYRQSKDSSFSPNEIQDIQFKLNRRRGSFYLDNDVWQALCRVERGKVSNKMRFAIYKRDDYRCRKCGRKTDDLEIDHIIPISKGGKSTYDNLQTLCHHCNYNKGSENE